MHVAIGAVETSSIAQGAVVADAMVKTAHVDLLEACSISPGKFWVLIGGEVAEVRASHQRGVEIAEDTRVDDLFIPQVHDHVYAALKGSVSSRDDDALGVIETLTAASLIVSADAAAKAAAVTLRDIRLANGLGGKGVLYLSGDVSNVEAAVQAGRELAVREGLLARSVVVPRLHPQLKARIF